MVGHNEWLVVGAGLSGCVVAEQLASKYDQRVFIIDKRDHIGGNCYDYVDNDTNIRLNKYGAHFFHTNYEDVWGYINRFSDWRRWEHKVLSYVDGQYHSVPINITTVNSIFNESIVDEIDMNMWLFNNQKRYHTIRNSEDMAKSRVGEVLYDKFFKNYTYKQWNKFPNELDASVLERIPIYKNYDTRYFRDKYQALPVNGYTDFFNKLVNHPNITLKLNTDFFSLQDKIPGSSNIVYTGPIDRYFDNCGYPALEYRSIDFNIKRYYDMNYYLPNSVVNYPGLDVSYTRKVEYKHILNQVSKDTIVVEETTNDSGEPYYPVPTYDNSVRYESYKSLAKKLEKDRNIYFLGRLATYKYINMDQAIKSALDFVEWWHDYSCV